MNRQIRHVIFISVLLLIGCGGGVGVPKYEVVNQERYDIPIKSQIALYAVVLDSITENGLRLALDHLYYEAGSQRGFKYHGGKPTHIFVYLYPSKEHYKTRQAIAILNKTGENAQVETIIKTEYIAPMYARPEIKYGLTEETRRKIFWESYEAEDRANAESDRMYPTKFKESAKAFSTLKKKYRLELKELYGITEEQLSEIETEGENKFWLCPLASQSEN